ncbi:tetratricopeptide repeat protein [Pseudomonas sp. nanlin1]|uniref:tetratricopeptide repeat protein n=1 Tax=Pseudomonas sp. nanlin1 TaxID=3040605 RepID=UPI003890BE9B
MNKWLFPALTALALLSGCASVQRGSIPVVDSGSAVSNGERVSRTGGGYRQPVPVQQQAQSLPEDSGVVVMIPGGGGSQPIQSYPAGAGSSMPITPGPVSSEPITPGPSSSAGAYASAPSTSYSMPPSSAPSGIPSAGGGLAADEQLDGPVLSLLTTAQQQQSGGDLNGASSSLERAQRIAPREPQVLYRLAQVRLAQGDAAQAEQLARRALTYANGRPDLQSSLWNTIAQARDRQGDAAGAALARQKAKVSG